MEIKPTHCKSNPRFNTIITKKIFSSVQFSHSVVSDYLRPHEWHHARPSCPSPTPGIHSDSRPSRNKILPPSHLPPHIISGSSPCTSPKHPVSCIEHRLAIRFLHDSMHVSVPFSQIIPPSPSPSESKSLFYIYVSLLLSHIQGYHYHLSKFHIYVLVRQWHPTPVLLPGKSMDGGAW